MSVPRSFAGLITAVPALCMMMGVSAHAAEPGPVRSSTTFPYTLARPLGVPLVQVKVDGKVTGTFVLDTGSNLTAITDSIAAKLGLAPKPFLKNGKPYLVAGAPSQYVSVTYLQVGGFRLGGNNGILMLDSRRLSSLVGQPVDGILGANALSVFGVMLDCPQHKVTLWYPAGFSAQESVRLGFGTYAGIDMSTPADDFIYIGAGTIPERTCFRAAEAVD